MKSIQLSALFILMTAFSFAQSNNIEKKKWHWGKSESNTTAGYTHAVLVDNVLYISGTVGQGVTMAEQLKSVYEGLEKTLKNYNLSFQNVVKENLYTTDIEAVKQSNEIRKAFYNGDFPASTWTQISRLYSPTALVEVEVIAHLPRK